jgi:hypothetical protein
VTDHKASVKIDFTIYGEHFDTDMWINWVPDDDYSIDQRVLDWFADCYWKARSKWDQALADHEAAAEEGRDRAELARLLSKYPPADR